MGNYRNVDTEFIERTLAVISQYESILHNFEFEHQYNHTLLINCLLGLIVFPKENNIYYLPKSILDENLKKEMGVSKSIFNSDITNLKDLIISLRHSLAHFDIQFHSIDENFLIDEIIFKDKYKGNNYIVANFKPEELLSFIRYYGWWLINNINNYKNYDKSSH